MRSIVNLLTAVLYWPLELARKTWRIGAKPWARRRFQSCGVGLTFEPTSSWVHYGTVSVGDRVHLGPGVFLSGKITIGNDVMLAHDVHVTDGYHRWDVLGKTIRESGPGDKVPVVIEDDVWIGAGASIMRGVTVGEGSVVGARSVVTHDVPPYSIVAGVPARLIRERFTASEIAEHRRLRGHG